MDWLNIRKSITGIVDKYKFVILIVALGIFFMMLPGETDPEIQPATQEITQTKASIEEELTQILSQIQGVGKVRVMITEMTGPETIYQVDEDRTEGEGSLSVRRETVIFSGNGTESGLVRTVTPATYLGAIIVCQGASSPSVRLAVSGAVSAVTGISTDRISVLEMK